MKKYFAAVPAVLFTTAAFAAGPSAGDLTGLVPDSATILTAVAAIGVVVIGVTLALAGFGIARKEAGKIGK